MNLNEFVTKYTNKAVDVDGAYGNQCMDLMHRYCMDVFGLSRTDLSAPAAKDVFNNFTSMRGREHFERIFNTPEAVPQPGDIVFFGDKIGQYGHVSIFLEGDINSFISFDQNFPLKSLPHRQSHNYKAVLGWLRYKKHPKQQENTAMPFKVYETAKDWFDFAHTMGVFPWRQLDSTDADKEFAYNQWQNGGGEPWTVIQNQYRDELRAFLDPDHYVTVARSELAEKDEKIRALTEQLAKAGHVAPVIDNPTLPEVKQANALLRFLQTIFTPKGDK